MHRAIAPSGWDCAWPSERDHRRALSIPFMPAAQKPPSARLRPSPRKCYIQAMRFLASTVVCLAALVRLACAQPDLASESRQGKELMAAGRFEEAIPIYKD